MSADTVTYCQQQGYGCWPGGSGTACEVCGAPVEGEPTEEYERTLSDACQPFGCGDLYGAQCAVCGSWYDRGGYFDSDHTNGWHEAWHCPAEAGGVGPLVEAWTVEDDAYSG
jgi:hypothetical protein